MKIIKKIFGVDGTIPDTVRVQNDGRISQCAKLKLINEIKHHGQTRFSKMGGTRQFFATKKHFLPKVCVFLHFCLYNTQILY